MMPQFDSSESFPFFIKFDEDLIKTGTSPDGVPSYKTEEIVLLIKGNNKQPVRVSEYKVRHPVEWARYVEPIYIKWKASKDEMPQGMPLDVVPCLEKVNVLQLNSVEIYTAEQLLEAEDAKLEIVPNGLKLREDVKRFIEAGKRVADVTKLIKDNERLEQRVKFLEAKLEKVAAQSKGE